MVMINTNFRTYDFFTFGDRDEYGQPKLSEEVMGAVKMAITTTSQNVQDNVLYSGASYMGLTHDKRVNDSFVIDYEGTKLKVLYTSPQGRLRAVFMAKMG
jgi:hypothetical protein